MKLYWLSSAIWLGSRLFGIRGHGYYPYCWLPFCLPPLLFVHTLGLSDYLKSTKYHMVSHAVTFWLHEKSFPSLFPELTIIFSEKFSSDFIFSKKPFQNLQLTLYPPLICLAPTILHWYMSLRVSAFYFRLQNSSYSFLYISNLTLWWYKTSIRYIFLKLLN